MPCFCVACDSRNSFYYGDSPIHGALKKLDPKAGLDQASLSYTQLPVPAELTVKPSNIPCAGLGVFANKFIPRGVKVGPYEGERVDKADLGDLPSTSYVWEVGTCNVSLISAYYL
jgi:hypothetical protein